MRNYAWTYLFRLFLTYILYEMTALKLLSPVWIALVVAFPTFGYLYLRCAQMLDSIFYVKVMYEWFHWDSKRYYTSWIGLLLTPILTVIGYLIGVMLAIREPFVLMVLTFATNSYFVYKFLKLK